MEIQSDKIAWTILFLVFALGMMAIVFNPWFWISAVATTSLLLTFITSYSPGEMVHIKKPQLRKERPVQLADPAKIAELEQSLGLDYKVPQDVIKSKNSKYPALPPDYKWEFKYNPEQKDYRGNITYWEDYEVIVWYKGGNSIHRLMVEPRRHSGLEAMSVALDKAIAKCYKKTMEHYAERDMRQTIMNDYKIGD